MYVYKLHNLVFPNILDEQYSVSKYLHSYHREENSSLLSVAEEIVELMPKCFPQHLHMGEAKIKILQRDRDN